MGTSMRRLILLAGIALGSACAEPPPPGGSTRAASPRLPEGRYAFDLEWRTTTHAPDPLRPGEQTSAALAVDAQLVLDVPAPDALHHYVRMTVVDVSRFGWTTGESEEIDPSRGQLDGCSAWVDLHEGPPGELLRDGPLAPGCEHALTHIAVNLDLLPPDPGAPRSVLGNYGRGFAEYASELRAFTRTLHGETAGGLTFAGRSRVELDARGRPTDLDSAQWTTQDDTERGVEARSELRLRRASVADGGAIVRPPADALAAVSFEPALDGTLARRQQAAAFADGLDPQMMALVLRGVDDGAKLAPGFAIRARGLMIANPELAHGVGELFNAAQSTTSRQIVADMLAQADTPQAQAVLRGVVEREVSAGADDRTLILQRLAFVDRPDRASFELALRLHAAATRDEDHSVVAASLHLLGELARQLGPKHPALSGMAMKLLRDTLDDGDDPLLLAAALGGLGNAGDPADVTRVLQIVATGDDRLRSLAALALRRMPGPSVAPTLLTLVHDESALVSARAESALALRGEVQA